jgi:hypothetical protein
MSEALDIDLDLTNLSADDLEGDGSPPPGKYHARIEDMQRVSDQNSYLKVRLSLLAGTDANGVGCVFSERFYLSDKAKKRLAILAHRLHLLADDSFGSRVSVNWFDAIGKQLIVQVVEEEYEAKGGAKAKRSKLAFAGFWGLDDERVKDVPRDQAALRQPGAKYQAAPPKSMSTAAKSAGGDWDTI